MKDDLGIKGSRRLAVRLSLTIVLVLVTFESLLVVAFQTLGPTWPLPREERLRYNRAVVQSQSGFGRDARAILNNFRIDSTVQKEQLMTLLNSRLEAFPRADTSVIADILLETYRPQTWFSPVFLLFWILVPAALLTLWLSRRLVRPVVALAKAADGLTRGDLSVRVPITPQLSGAKDELTLLTSRFNTMAATLESLEIERKHMIADIAHELRTPLAVLRGQLDALQDGVFPLTQEELLSLAGETDVLIRLVEDLRVLSLAEAKRLTLEPQPTELVAELRTVLKSFELQALSAEVTLKLITESSACWLELDPQRCYQVWSNLLTNALAHTPGGGSVQVVLTCAEEAVSVAVEDEGPGIPDEAMPHLFDRFYRNEVNRRKDGSGLGLAVVKSLVELQGGSVTASNRVQGGAVFTVRLPRH